jgi:hypothetical protein
MASLRNLAISALRRAGHRNIAAGLRWAARDSPDPSPCSAYDSDDFAGAVGGGVAPHRVVDLEPAAVQEIAIRARTADKNAA